MQWQNSGVNKMNKYLIYLETVEDKPPFDIIEREFVDVCNAESITDCLMKTDWSSEYAESNEQYCITEEYSDGYETEYYPFGEAKVITDYKNPPKYSDSVMRNVRQAFGLEHNDTSLDEKINKMDQMDVFEKWLQWEGIFGYTYRIKEAVDNIFYGKRGE